MKRLAIALALLSLGSLAGCDKPAEQAKAVLERPVSVVTVHLAPASTPRALVGVVRARVESNLGFRVSGKIARRLVDRGAVVKVGQALATLDETDWKLQLQQAEAALSAAQAGSDQAVAERDRIAALRKRGWSTNSDFDKTNATADQAIGNRDQAAKAVTLAQNALSYATLVADADGIVTSTPAEPGQVVSAGQPVIGLAHADMREADVSVPETLIDEARQGTATVSLWSQPDKVYRARLRELTPSADAATRTYPARFSIEDSGPDIALGMTATVTLSSPSAAVARLPLGAILDEGHGPMVFVVDTASNEVTARPVKVSSYEADAAIVASGLSEGETVVALGVQKLHAGETIRLASADGD